MNIFEVTDYGGDKLSVDLDQNDPPIQSGRFMATIISHETPITCKSVIFTDDAARALIKALREALPPEETAQAAPAPDLPRQAYLGLATTRQLLAEISARIEVDRFRGGGGLDYRTVDGVS